MGSLPYSQQWKIPTFHDRPRNGLVMSYIQEERNYCLHHIFSLIRARMAFCLPNDCPAYCVCARVSWPRKADDRCQEYC